MASNGSTRCVSESWKILKPPTRCRKHAYTTIHSAWKMGKSKKTRRLKHSTLGLKGHCLHLCQIPPYRTAPRHRIGDTQPSTPPHPLELWVIVANHGSLFMHKICRSSFKRCKASLEILSVSVETWLSIYVDKRGYIVASNS